MSVHPVRHLSDDELVSAVMDASGLTGAARRHLDDCARCQRTRHRLITELTLLGRLTRRTVSVPRFNVQLPERQAPRFMPLRRWPTLTLGAVGSLAAVMFVIWLTPLMNPPGMDGSHHAANPQNDPDVVLVQIWNLAEDALPDAYLDIALVRDSDEEAVEPDWMDLIIPPLFPPEDTSSIMIESGGTIAC